MRISGIGLFIGLALLVATQSVASIESARQLAAQGDPRSALGVVEELLDGEPESADGLFLKGVLLVELRRAKEAVGVFEQLTELYPELPEPYNNLAVIQAAGGDYEAAVATLRRSLQTNSSYRTAYENLTKIYSQLASDAYSQALETDAGDSSGVVELVLLGTLAAGQPADAVADAPRPEVQLAAVEPTAVAHADPAPQPVPPPTPVAEAVAEAEPVAEPELKGEPEPEAEVEPAPESEAMPEAEPTEAEAAHASVSRVASFVESWRSAWQAQDVDAYLASYAAGFAPVDGTSRRAWEEQRHQRLAAPSFIRVTLAFLDEPQVNEDSAQIRFLQSYESDTFQDRVTKTLVLVWEQDGWKILEERSD